MSITNCEKFITYLIISSLRNELNFLVLITPFKMRQHYRDYWKMFLHFYRTKRNMNKDFIYIDQSLSQTSQDYPRFFVYFWDEINDQLLCKWQKNNLILCYRKKYFLLDILFARKEKFALINKKVEECSIPSSTEAKTTS